MLPSAPDGQTPPIPAHFRPADYPPPPSAQCFRSVGSILCQPASLPALRLKLEPVGPAPP